MEQQPCPTCGALNPSAARLCGMCGSSLVQDEAAGEVRRVVTLVTSDLKGSTALGERLDPEALREVLNRYFAVMRAVFESHGGTIEKIIGDAIVAVFGLPFRHDDDPIRALEAAAESQRALVTLNEELEQGWGVRLVVRTGVATGEVTFGRAEAGQHVLLGPPVDVSTLMEQNSPPLEVMVAQSTADAAGDIAELEALEPVSPKGSEERFAGYRLVSVRTRGSEAAAAIPDAAPGMRSCPSCGEQSPELMRYCTTCGASLSEVTATESRRTVTIVFAMPKIRTASGEPAEPDALRQVMSRYFDAMKAALQRHGGTVEKFIGDAVMAVFGLPVRHEDDAVRAIRAAADMQAAMPALNAAFTTELGIELMNHIGVNTGEVIAGDASTGQRLVTGDAVNTAARLEQAAGPSQVVLGDLTYRLARDQVEAEPIPPLTLKGKAEPVPAFRLVGVAGRPAERQSQNTPFVGREAELTRLSDSLAGALSARKARLVTVVGDAGVGKSRLIREFAEAAAGDARILRGRCLPYGDGITFWPFGEVVREAAGITGDDTPEIAVGKIGQLLARTAPEAADEHPAIAERVAAAINLSTTQYPVAELFWGARRILETLAAERPLALIVDDIHSAEATFLELLDHLLEAVDGAPILLLCSARHELNERHPEWAESHASDTIALAPLTEADAGQVVEKLLGALDASVRRRIADASEGNPLYVEQIVSMLMETGAIERDGDRWVARHGTDELRIPPTVQALVAARLDALGGEERAVVDPASVVGLAFPQDAVAELVLDAVREHLEPDLVALEGKQLIRRAPGDEVIYRFGHQVIRDTAYGSLLKRVRAALHERFVVWAERVNKERGREIEFEEILGYHLEQAYRYRTELSIADADAASVGERAAAKLSSAGRRALERGDLSAAVSLLRRSVALLPRGSHFRVELMVDLADGLLQQGGFEDAKAVLTEAAEIGAELGDERLEARVRLLRVSLDVFTGARAGGRFALDEVQRAVPVLEAAGDDAGLARAWRLAMQTEIMLGRLDAASVAAGRVVEHATRAADRRLASRSATSIAYINVHGPLPVTEAIARCEELLASVQGDRKVEAVILSSLAQLRAMDGDFEAARELYRRGQAILAELGAGIDLHSTSIDSSQVERLAGDLAAAEAELRRDYAALDELGESYFRSTIAAFLAQVLWSAGKQEDADGFARIAEQIADPEDILSQVPWRGVRAKLIAARGDAAEARALADGAVAMARDTGDLALQAGAVTDLADVLELLGDRDEAGRLFEQALELYRRKGDQVSAERIAGRLAVVAG